MDINKMFMNKNYEILKKKLDLDINNNADSLNHTVSNFIDLKAIGLRQLVVGIAWLLPLSLHAVFLY